MKRLLLTHYYIFSFYRLPVMITKKDIEMEKIYLNYYNDAYWEEYKKKKLDEYNDKTGTV